MRTNPRLRQCMTRAYQLIVWGAVLLLVPLDVWAFFTYRDESIEIARIAAEQTEGCQTPLNELRHLVRFLSSEVPGNRPDSYFLLPVLDV